MIVLKYISASCLKYVYLSLDNRLFPIKMNLTDDSPCVIGSSCRLPGATRTDALWQLFCDNSWKSRSTLPPSSRGLSIPSPIPSTGGRDLGHGGWLGEEGIEKFDPSFFDIPTHEAATLRPNVRLGLELTWEALENAGIPPSSLRGRSVSVSIAVGTEDGWDMKRWQDEGSGAFNRTWASSSDPSGVSGHISHFFDFRGSCSVVSNACAGGAFALKEGIFFFGECQILNKSSICRNQHAISGERRNCHCGCSRNTFQSCTFRVGCRYWRSFEMWPFRGVLP